MQSAPNGFDVDRTIGMNIHVACILNYPPRNAAVFLPRFVRQRAGKLAYLKNTHTAGVLKKKVAAEGIV